MKIIAGKEKEYSDWKDLNMEDDYSAETFNFAERWADGMEKRMLEVCIDDYPNKLSKSVLESIKDKSMREADINGISGYQFSCAVQILNQMWVYGSIL